jgi:hypothetical protein
MVVGEQTKEPTKLASHELDRKEGGNDESRIPNGKDKEGPDKEDKAE